jgi:hypothetical protein
MLEVARVVASRDDPLAEVSLLRHLADHDVVLVVTGNGDDQIGPSYSSTLEDP